MHIINAPFQLAKQHHPDLKMHQNQDEDGTSDIMTEIITAYETLMNKHNEHFWTDARDSRVALACEMYTMEELMSMRDVFDVHSFRVIFNSSSDDDCDGDGQRNVATTDTDEAGGNPTVEESSAPGNRHLDPAPIVPLRAHPDDSISDVKRQIQTSNAATWGLHDRRVDRDGLYLGWELVHCGNQCGSVASGDGRALSYHLFLHSYDIQENDVLYAVVRR